jgi:hypothetical protein
VKVDKFGGKKIKIFDQKKDNMEILNSIYMNKAQEKFGRQFDEPVASMTLKNKDRFHRVLSPMKRDILDGL